MTTRAAIDEFLAHKTIALVGVSRSGKKFGNAVRKELSAKGYDLLVIHPEVEEIGGASCSRSLADVSGATRAAVLVTPPAETERLVREAAAAGIERIWMQQGAESEAAIAWCREQGIEVVHNECILMFAEPTGFPHRAHRWFRKVFNPKRMPA